MKEKINIYDIVLILAILGSFLTSFSWIILEIVAFILLAIYWRGRNAVWGGLQIGIILGLIFSTISFFIGYGFSLYPILKFAIIGVIWGFCSELLAKISKKSRKNNNLNP